MKPKGLSPEQPGLLEYLEEIIGSSQHVEELDSLSKQCELENEKRIEQLNRVKAAQSDLDSHKSDYDQACQFIFSERRLYKFLCYQLFIQLQKSV